MRQLEELCSEMPDNQLGIKSGAKHWVYGARALDLAKQSAESDRKARRRSKRLLNRQGVSFMAGPEAERGQ